MARPYKARPKYRYLLAGLLLTLFGAANGDAQTPVAHLAAPPGFSVELFADSLAEPWGLAFSPDGRLYTSLRAAGQVVWLRDDDGDGVAEGSTTVVDGLAAPSGLAFLHESLWIVDAPRVLRLDVMAGDSAGVQVVIDDLPVREIPPSPILVDQSGGAFFLAVGAACGACSAEDPRQSTVVRYAVDGTAGQVWARGLRHVTAMTVNPETSELWAVEAGRDDLGSDVPTGELNVVRRGGHYGWPDCHGQRVPAPEYADPRRCDVSERPVFVFPAGSAPAGLVFYVDGDFPSAYYGDAFVALTGSVPRIVRLRVAAGRPVALESFVNGWAGAGGISGHPQSLAVSPDGSLYVADPPAGRIWRVVYTAGSGVP
ncbi:MAG TPA: PQQ-dependent sugar dehydrogenase [Gemmatimonadota bacterium]|nr:PQQ-dependent sugar dehydrogenase [Gemmatimonadota bacterium]